MKRYEKIYRVRLDERTVKMLAELKNLVINNSYFIRLAVKENLEREFSYLKKT